MIDQSCGSTEPHGPHEHYGSPAAIRRDCPGIPPTNEPVDTNFGADPSPRFCRICRWVVDWSLAPGATERKAVHPGGAPQDHQPIPVTLDQLDGPPEIRCDFCSEPALPGVYFLAEPVVTYASKVTATVVSAGDYASRHKAARVRRADTTPVPDRDWGQRWLACPGCEPLVQAGDLLGLVSRVTATLPKKLTSKLPRLLEVRGRLMGDWEVLFATRAPFVGYATAQAPLGVWPGDPGYPDEPGDSDDGSALRP